jgi:hypothetical protein
MTDILFDKITKEQIQSAARYIDEHGIPADRVSREYDSWVDGKVENPHIITPPIRFKVTP